MGWRSPFVFLLRDDSVESILHQLPPLYLCMDSIHCVLCECLGVFSVCLVCVCVCVCV